VLKYYFARIWASDTTPEGAVRSSRLTPRVFPCWHHQRGAMFEPCHFRSSLNRVQAEGSAPKISMQKIYLLRWSDKPKSFATDYFFCLKPNEAAVCSTREQAEMECNFLNQQPITFVSETRPTVICNFKIEERTTGGFVFFFETP